MALIASIQAARLGISWLDMSQDSGINPMRLRAINNGRTKIKYPEQVALESLLTDETVAKLKQLYYATPALTFWDRYITEGGTHARRK
jgi:hypothetical protein